MKTFDNITPENRLSIVNSYDTVYFPKFDLSMSCNQNSITISDVSNAFLRGKIVTELSINKDWASGDKALCNIFMNVTCIKEMFDSLLKIANTSKHIPIYQDEPISPENRATVYIRQKKGVDFYSEFKLNNIKPLKAEPKKWNLSSVIRALANKQCEGLKCNYKYTDDYAYDNATDYGKGEVDPDSMLRSIYNVKRGYSVSYYDGLVKIYFTNSESYCFKFKLK